MNGKILAPILLALLCSCSALIAETLTDKLLTESDKIWSLQCDIRRETELGGQVLLTMSRVRFERPDRLQVETMAPDLRKIVVDGKAIHKWIKGQETGVRIPLSEASEGDLLQVRRVPATADEYLLRLKGAPETILPTEAGFPLRRAYSAPSPHPYTELALDATGRLARIEFFDPAARTNRLLRVEFEGWREIKPGIWIACLQKTEAKAHDGTKVRETLRVSSLVVNEPIQPEQFDAARCIPGVKFIKPEEMMEFLRHDENNLKK